MFTGLVQAIGCVEARSGGVFTIAAPWASSLQIGESVAVSGVCLTVIKTTATTFDVDVSPTTLALTTLDHWQPGQEVNLERAMSLGDRLGGHLVTGHVDATSTLLERVPADNSDRLRFAIPPQLASHFVPQGSVAVDGTSLTLNEIAEGWFWVTIIPETSRNTTLGKLAVGGPVNLETDVIGKYVERVLAVRGIAGATGALAPVQTPMAAPFTAPNH